MFQASKAHPPRGGYQRFTLDIPSEDHCRFKALCAMKATTMRAEMQAVIAAQLSMPDMLLSEALTELVEHARARRMPLKKLIAELLGRMWEKPAEPEAEGIQLVRPA
jgi:hypothetical protein